MPREPVKPYVPQGKMVDLLAALEAEPNRTFSGHEAADIIGGDVRQVSSFVFYAERAGRVFKRVVGSGKNRRLQLRATPFPDAAAAKGRKPSDDMARQTWKEGGVQASARWLTDPNDPRIGKVDPTWKAPVMRHVRGGQ